MMKISKSTKDIITKLGYEGSDNFYYFTDLDSCKDISLHDSKVIKILKPVAFFVVKGKPKVLFLIMRIFNIVSKNYTKRFGIIKYQ